MKKNRRFLSQERLREIAWEVGAKYPTPLTGDHITLLTVNPRRGFLHWQIRKESVEALKVTHGEGFNGAHIDYLQCVRELLLTQSSDWPFMINNGTSAGYATRRVKDHVARFHYLADSIENNSISEDHLSALEQMDNIFPNADYRLFRRMRENSNKSWRSGFGAGKKWKRTSFSVLK